MTEPLPERPFRRPFPLTVRFPESSSPVRRAWDRSVVAVESIRERLDGLGETALASVYVSGSLGRMEGRDDSDWDLIFVLRDDADPLPGGSEAYGRDLWERLDPSCRLRPEPNGIFATPIGPRELADPKHRGALSDSPARFGKRIQLLLDAQPVWGDAEAGRGAALSFYELDERDEKAGAGVYLFNDLVRYHRSLCAMTQWLPDQASDKTRRLKIKLRFSRFLNYLGLLLPLAQGIDRGDVAQSLDPFWNLTPLERVLQFANDQSESAVEAFCRSYEAFLAFLETSDPGPDDWNAIEKRSDRFRESACEILRSQPFLQRGRAADLLLL